MKKYIKYIIAVSLLAVLLVSEFLYVFADYSFECIQEIRNSSLENDYVLSTPTSVDRDQSGNYYIADLANNRVLKLDANMNKINQIDYLDMPITVYIDNQQNILICELGTHKILKYNSDFVRLLEWGGQGEAYGEFNIPRSIVQDSRGNYFVSDELNHRIQKFDINGNFLQAYGTYGDANGQFKVQQGLAIDQSDRLYVADTYNNRIQIFDTYPNWIHLRSFGQFGVYEPFNYFSFQPGIFNHPRNVDVNKNTGDILVTDSLNNRVMVYSSYGRGIRFKQSQNGYLTMNLPTDSFLEDNGRVVVLDSYNRIIKYNSRLNNTNLFSQFGLGSASVERFCGPQSVEIDTINEDIYITDSFNHRIKKYDSNGNYVTSYGGIGGPYGIGTLLNYFAYPKQICFDRDGNLYVADFGNRRIVSKSRSGSGFDLAVGSYNLGLPWGVAVDNEGKIYVSDWKENKIKVFRNGSMINSWGGYGVTEGLFNRPCELEIGEYNGQKIIAVADTLNNRIQIFTLSGELFSVIGAPTGDPLEEYTNQYLQGKLLLPYSMTFDLNGNIIVSDTSHKCIRVYSIQGELLGTYGNMSNSNGNFFSPMGCDSKENTLWVVDGVLQKAIKFNIVYP